MSYLSATLDHKDQKVIVWERTGEGRRRVEYDPPYYFYVPDDDGEYKSLFGDKLTRLDFNTRQEFYNAKKTYKERCDLFESDISPTLKILSEHYFDQAAPTLHTTFFDIEVDYDKDIGFSSPRTAETAYAPINAVAFYHDWLDKYVVLVVPPQQHEDKILNQRGEDSWTTESLLEEVSACEKLPDEMTIDLHICDDETKLLERFLSEIEDSDVLSGWNSDFFDIPYIGRRLKKKLGEVGLRSLNFDMRYFEQYTRTPEDMHVDKPFRGVMTKYGSEAVTLDLSGRVKLDYMELFRKFEMAERPSYKLEAIADEIIPELPKLEYEGSLHSLYRDNFPMFVRYNIRDTEVLHGFEQKLGYVALANEMVHLSTGLFQNIQGTIALAQLSTINYCHHKLGVIAPDNKPPKNEGQIQGAFVLLPQVDMHEWIGSVDINSLYPSAIRSINISPETLRGQFVETTRAPELIAINSDEELTLEFESGEEYTLPAKTWRKKLQKVKWAVSGYGTVFDQNVKGVMPMILEDWYNTRKMYQRKKKEAIESGDKQKVAYYDRLQYCYKIKLNSYYGALTNQHFKFYDLRMGESTTGTGRMILLHQCAETVKILDGEYMMPNRHEEEITKKTGQIKHHVGYTDDTSLIYGDTDSSYFKTHGTNEKEAVLIADHVGKLVNSSFPEYMRNTFLCTEGFDGIIKTGREIVSDRGIFVDKKRYVLHIVDDEGVKKDKLKVMGLDTKKTTLPKIVSNNLNKFIERFLKGESWDTIAQDIVAYKDELIASKNVLDIGLPKGVKQVEYYLHQLQLYGDTVRLPGHVAASIFYNQCLEENKDMESMRITSGMKIKVYYLQGQHTRGFGVEKDANGETKVTHVRKFKSIALPTDIECVPQWFTDHFVPQLDLDAQIERLVDNPLENILKAIKKESPTKQSLYVDSYLEF